MKKFNQAILAVLLYQLSASAFAVLYTEDFADPLSGWVSDWLYQNSNLQNYYVAGGNCDDNARGNQPDGLWVSDDRACGSLVEVSPVTININPQLGDTATCFTLDAYACYSDGTLNVYDKDGVLGFSTPVSDACFSFANNYQFNLTNGISAFEFDSTSTQIEGNTAIDNVTLDDVNQCPGGVPPLQPEVPVPTMTTWALVLLAGLLAGGAWIALRRRVGMAG